MPGTRLKHACCHCSGFCYVWHEGIASRGPNEIGLCVYNFLVDHLSDVKHATFYSDNCGGQNRNKFIALMYLKAVSSTPIQSITHKFLEVGHTQNEGDSMHSTIERSKGRCPIYSPQLSSFTLLSEWQRSQVTRMRWRKWQLKTFSIGRHWLKLGKEWGRPLGALEWYQNLAGPKRITWEILL